MFAKRHYEAIARALQEACPEPHWDANKRAQFDVTVSRLCDAFKRDNAAFNRDRFIAACQPGANVRARNYKVVQPVQLTIVPHDTKPIRVRVTMKEPT